MELRTLADAEAALQKYVPLVAKYGKDDMTLERLWPLLQQAGNPQDKLRVVHVAGTSGKTSTSYYACELLRLSGKKVGLSVSPHIDSIGERVQINNTCLDEALFCHYLEKFLLFVDNVKQTPSYFEILIAFAIWVFDQEQVDYAVLETGLGGILDGSNVVTAPSKVCILTDIGLDHTALLGNTVQEIASHKAGIMHASNQAFVYKQADEIMNVFKAHADKVGATLHMYNESELYLNAPTSIAQLPGYQQRNWLLATQAYKYIAKRDNFTTLDDATLSTSMHVAVPGRMQIATIQGHNIIMDGAHNQQKMHAFVKSYLQMYGPERVPVLLALKKDKDYCAVLRELLPITSQLVITTFNIIQDRPNMSADPSQLMEHCKNAGFTNCTVIPDCSEALRSMLTTSADRYIITGSLYLISQVRALNRASAQA